MSELFSNPYTVLGVILVASIGGYIQWRNGYKVRRAVACATFRAAIDRELLSLLSAWPQDIDKMLISRYSTIESSVREFRHYVPLWRRCSFDRAWFVYQYGSGGADIGSHYYQYMGYSSPDTHIPDSKAIFKTNVERLLFYAKET